MATYLITGANRGIGRAMAAHLASRGDTVLGTAREPDAAAPLEGVEMLRLDVADFASIDALATQVGDRAIDVLINNAGVYNDKAGIDETDLELLTDCLRVNVAGPLGVTRAVLPALGRSERKMVVNISSAMGSIGGTRKGGSYGYRASKAALNMVTKVLSVELEPRGVGVVCVHPGWVETDMGGAGATLRPDDSAASIVASVDVLDLGDTGRFLNYDGEPLPW